MTLVSEKHFLRILLIFLLTGQLWTANVLAGPTSVSGNSNGSASLWSYSIDPDSSFSLNVTYMGEFLGNVVGGRQTGVAYLDNMNILLDYKPQIAEWKGARFHLYMLGNQGGNISSLVGDAQGVSNIEAVNSWRLFEALYFQRLEMLNTSLMAGIYDVNTEFDLTYTGSFFLNSSHGIGAGFGQSGVTGPSTFPNSGLAIRNRTRLLPGVVLKAAVCIWESWS